MRAGAGAGSGPPAPYSNRLRPPSLPSSAPSPLLDGLDLFAVAPGLPVPRRGGWLAATAFLHVAAVAALVLVPLFAPDNLREWGPDPLRVLIYDPPPPPPPPLPLGSTTGGRVRAPVEPLPVPTPAVLAPSSLIAPVEKTEVPDDSVGLTVDAPGSPHGSESGIPEGMEEGVPGGVVGGIPGGVVGGVIGGTGTGPVPIPVRDVDRPPRLLQQIRPTYPSEAFVKKVEGTVVIEIVIDERGRVVRTRIVRSEPLLDAAAVAAVRQWVFAPALKQGRAVATLAMAPVTFRIF